MSGQIGLKTPLGGVITINSGVVVTVASGSTWVVL